MSKAIYPVVDGTTRKGKKLYSVLDGITHTVKRAYYVADGATKLFFVDGALAYTGECTATDVEIDGVAYTLYALTTSGTLTLNEDAQVWACGGGGGGNRGTYNSYYPFGGGGGGGGYVISGEISTGDYVVLIGSGGKADANGGGTTIGSYSADGGKHGDKVYNGGNGGSGGGGAGRNTNSNYVNGTAGKGAGVSTIPFGLTDMHAHCAGGGGGGNAYRLSDSTRPAKGGDGGTNGGNGSKAISGRMEDGGAGGTYGGGAGGSYFSYAGKSASYYGSAGGGGFAENIMEQTKTGAGAGYQGIVYVLIPVKEE